MVCLQIPNSKYSIEERKIERTRLKSIENDALGYPLRYCQIDNVNVDFNPLLQKTPYKADLGKFCYFSIHFENGIYFQHSSAYMNFCTN